MKKILKMTAVALSACMALSPFASLAPVNAAMDDITPIASAIEEQQKRAAYSSYSGTITAINEHSTDPSIQYVSLNSETQGEATFVITESTYLSSAALLQVGAEIIGFYDANRPMLMIYPPQYQVEVVLEAPAEGVAMKADRFDAGSMSDAPLLSQDGELKLNIGEETEIIDLEGNSYTGELAGRKLLVTYSFETSSIPAQTTPQKVIVLDSSDGTPADEGNVEEGVPEMPAMSAFYAFVSGTVTSIDEAAGVTNVTVVSEEGGEAVFMLKEDTVLFAGLQIELGTEIIGFFEANKPLTLQYPPRYDVKIVMPASEEESFIKADRFDEQLLSSDGELKLNVSEKTEIVDLQGEAYSGELGEQKLIVFYTITTRSIPAQTHPHKIVVVNLEDAEEPAITIDEPGETDQPAEELFDAAEVPGFPIVVAGKVITAPAAFVGAEGQVMVPLRVIAEALGYEVTWSSSARTVGVGAAISFAVDADHYKSADLLFALGANAVIRDDVTYVPLQFFSTVVGLNNARVFEGQIVVDK